MHILITGSRDWEGWPALSLVLSDAYLKSRGTEQFTLVHGACPTGADAMAAEWAAVMRSSGWIVGEIARPANWSKHGRGAGPIRNAELVGLVAAVAKTETVLCLAFIGPCTKDTCKDPQPHGSHGASGCADLAEAAGIKTVRYPIQTREDAK